MAFVFAAFPVNGYPTGSFPLLGFPGYTPEEPTEARRRGRKQFKSKKELEALEKLILAEDEEMLVFVTTLFDTELLN